MASSDKPLGWKDIEVGAIVTEPGGARQYRTGDWRSQRPVWDRSKCIKCGLCYLFCPEPAVKEDAEGYFDNDLYYCKGCGVCVRECWTGAITMVEEEE
ncbi:MAG: 4Fe-4S binding protein [Deltaproteobacteria bacterium]|nr:MAG: 4Fe-4S binding protein [Deltaproteobacteria bacterium]